MTDPRTILASQAKPEPKPEPKPKRKRAYYPPYIAGCPWLIRLWRAARGKSRADVNAEMGISPGDIGLYRVEAYKQAISDSKLEDIALVLDVSVDELRRDTTTRARHRAEYDAWVAAGKPDLGEWFALSGWNSPV